MRTLAVISMAAAAILLVGCDSSGLQTPGSVASTSADSTSTPVTQGCYPLSQAIPFSGSATLGTSSAIGNGRELALGVVKSVVNPPGSVNSSYAGSSADGSISFNAQGTGIAAVQGILEISQAAYDQAMSELPTASQYCVQSMSFDLEVAQDSSSQDTLFGGQVTLIVNGTTITLSF